MPDRNGRVLIADDNLAFRILIEQALLATGLDVECVADGDEAQRRVVESPPDLVLLDNVMPGRSGTEVCRALCDQLGDACPPIVMVTGCDGESDIAAAFDSGAVDYLVKPVNWALFKFRIAKWLDTNSAQRCPESSAALRPIEMMVSGRGEILELTSRGHLSVDLPQVHIESILEEFVEKQVLPLLRRVLHTRESRQEDFETDVAGRQETWTVCLDVRGQDKVSVTIYENAGTQGNQAQLFQLAYTDPATGLPNRHLFAQTLNDRLDRAKFRRRGLAVVCLTVLTPDGRQGRSLRHVEQLGALGKKFNAAWADESSFATFELPNTDSSCLASLDGQHAVAIIDNTPDSEWLANFIRQTDSLANDEMTICSGVAQFPQDGDTADLLIDSAIFAAKSAADTSAPAGSSGQAVSMQHYDDLESELLEALRADQLELFYQPRVDLLSGQVVAAEALIRWLHPLFGLINGAQLFDRLGNGVAIRELADWATASACKEAHGWLEAGLTFPVTINVADEQLVDDSFAERLLASIADLRLPPKFVELEVSESSCDRVRQSEKQLAEIRAAGLGLIIDDFTTGNVQLETLSRLSPSAFKIDLRRSRTDAGNVLAIARAVATGCDAILIAKHVETPDDLDRARVTGCEDVQGFQICQPLSRHDLREYVSTLTLSNTSSLDLAAMT